MDFGFDGALAPEITDLMLDVDADGISDMFDTDIDGDGIADAGVGIDMNGNGIKDHMDPSADFDGDFLPDSVDPFIDANHNGIQDVAKSSTFGNITLTNPF